MKTLLVTTASAFIGIISFASAAQAETQAFANPKVSGQRLDLCLEWGTGCGKPSADAWCVSKGFTTSSSHVVAHDIGAVTPTRLMSTGAVCDQPFCDGFSQVTCFKPGAPPAPDMQGYNKPKFNGMRLDLCVDWGVGCGLPAAKKYCQMKGWATAHSYVVANNIGAYAPTRLIGTSAVCDQDFCDGFKRIVCKN
ncbi:MAG TPA: hypothetical protein VF224_02660 [Aestuariivirga sp.]